MNATLVNFAAGETSPRSRGRFDAPWFPASCKKLLNFIPEIPGAASYRAGMKFIAQTRGGAVARLIPFQLNASRAYMLEFTTGFMRVYVDEALVVKPRTTVTAITKANPAVVTVVSTTGLTNGDEVIITGIVGMDELNGRQVKLAGGSGLTFQLVDPVTGANINSTNYTTYVSGGTLREVYQIASPYLADELDDIQFAQHDDTMYLVHPNYAPHKLTVDSGDNFTLGTYARTNDPFSATASPLTAITAITRGTITVLSFNVGTIIEGVLYTFTGVTGTTQINSPAGPFRLEIDHTPSPQAVGILKTAAGADVDSSAWGVFTGGGTATPNIENPIAVAFHEGRLFFIGSNQRPNSFWGSRLPSATGDPRYDDFTGGTDATHAVFFALAPSNGQNEYATWARGSPDYLFIGTFGGPFRVSGSGLDEIITATSINAKQIDALGCEAVMPAGGTRLFFIQRGGRTLRTIRVDPDTGKYISEDQCLNAEHIGYSRMRRVIFQAGRPDLIWVIREDGLLAGMTVQGSENVAGWHRHKIGGASALVLDAQPSPRTDRDDQLWVVTERILGSTTRRFVEILTDHVDFPDQEDFYTTADARTDDLRRFWNALYRLQERYIHLDAAATYDGSDRGTDLGATLTPAAVTGESVAFTASVASTFLASDVGREIWKKPDAVTGEGGGRATIRSVNGPGTIATCEITVDFDVVTAIAAGDWYLTATDIFVPHLDGERVAVVVDGAVYSDGRTDEYPTVTVANAKITLTEAAAVVHIGYPYEGILKTQNLEMGGRSGPAQNKPRNISEMFIRFLNTLGVDYGTDEYRLEQINHRTAEHSTSRPVPVFTGARKLHYPDEWSAEGGKSVVIAQRLPLPCTVQAIDVYYDTGDE